MISIITPVYNGEKFIASCIKVVIDQKCPDVEHIVIDGASTDKTVDIIKQYAAQYSHIRWISEKDRGQSDAMNKGIAMAKGNILAILNVDDYYEPNVLNRVLEIFKTLPEPSFLVGNCNVWNDEGQKISINKPSKLEFHKLLLAPHGTHFPINPSAYFYHISLHEKVGLYQVNEHYAMDYDFILRAVQVATVMYINETWGNYRLIEGTKTRNDEKSGQSTQRLERLLANYRNKLPIVQRWKIVFIREFAKQSNQLKYYLNRLKYYTQNEQLLLQYFKSKLTKILS
ncbi:glycosyltransferase family 2 protein [Calothrix sp. NIES-2098]|uniref:glycosyltransferase family 2 protein n=1 Tax=Calothrix sp. NIES-2098 TaxID=1954171 RepID=UPI000B5E2D60|nr:glycosyltransferase involved in cell wall biogenesis [Calothrix sp. NIES-2098]